MQEKIFQPIEYRNVDVKVRVTMSGFCLFL